MKQDFNDPAYIEFRRTHITASRIAAIMGEDPWKGPLDVYNEMVEGKTQEDNGAMAIGRTLEPHARRAYEEYTGIATDNPAFEHPEYPWLGASFDGISFAHDYIVEIKCPGSSSFDKMKKDGIPRHYWIQVQAQLFCVPEAREAHFFVCQCSDDFRVQDFFMITVPRSPMFHVELREATKSFWDNHIVPKIPPPQKYMKIDDEIYLSLEKRLEKIMEIKKKVEEEESDLKKHMIEIANGRTVEGLLTRINTSVRKGSIDESKMAENGLNVDDFRKPNKSYQTVSFIKIKV